MVFVASFEVDKDEWRASNAIIWFVDDVFRLLYIYFVQQQVRTDHQAGRQAVVIMLLLTCMLLVLLLLRVVCVVCLSAEPEQ